MGGLQEAGQGGRKELALRQPTPVCPGAGGSRGCGGPHFVAGTRNEVTRRGGTAWPGGTAIEEDLKEVLCGDLEGAREVGPSPGWPWS